MENNNLKKVFYCSTASRYYQEALAGTAANYKGYILVEHASPFPQKPTDGLMDKNWLKGLDKLARKKSGKLLLIRNQQTNYKTCRIFYVDCVGQKYLRITCSLHEAPGIDLETYINDKNTVWETTPFFMVCTNGKKDKCCARFGFPVFRFFENMPLPFSYNTWECSHIGGDRFAANAALMPFGIYYGRIRVEDIHEIINQTARGEIHAPNYRGLSRLSFFEQAVECGLRGYLMDYRIHFPLKFLKKETENNLKTVEVQAGNYGVFKMTLRREEIDYPHLLTCTSHALEKIVKYFLLSIEKL